MKNGFAKTIHFEIDLLCCRTQRLVDMKNFFLLKTTQVVILIHCVVIVVSFVGHLKSEEDFFLFLNFKTKSSEIDL